MTLTFLEFNGEIVDFETDEAFKLVLVVAQSKLDLAEIAAQLGAH